MRYAPPPSGCSVFRRANECGVSVGRCWLQTFRDSEHDVLIDLLSGHRADDSPSFKSHNRDGVTHDLTEQGRPCEWRRRAGYGRLIVVSATNIGKRPVRLTGLWLSGQPPPWWRVFLPRRFRKRTSSRSHHYESCVIGCSPQCLRLTPDARRRSRHTSTTMSRRWYLRRLSRVVTSTRTPVHLDRPQAALQDG